MLGTVRSDNKALAGVRICLVTSSHIGSNPRIVKEADALQAVGAVVHVIALVINRNAHLLERDESVVASKSWQCTCVQANGFVSRLFRKVLKKVGHFTYFLGVRNFRALWWAYNPVIGLLATEVCHQKADLYIAHNLAALPAAWQAAQRHHAKLGFDAEDFHSGELSDAHADTTIKALAQTLEKRYLPDCDYVTAASPGIARAYVQTCGIQEPLVVLNVFPKADGPAGPDACGRAQPRPSLYWFSQTIGADRGLETVVEAIGRSQCHPVLYLRGSLADGYQAKLLALADDCGLIDQIIFLPSAAPDEMARLASLYDVGLATEVDTTVNRDICLTNKIFTYLLAGIPILASATKAQKEVAENLEGAIWCYPQGDSQSLAMLMDVLLLNANLLLNSRQLAYSYGQTQFNWDFESIKFINLIKNVVSKKH